MTYTPDTPIEGPPQGTARGFIDAAIAHGAKRIEFVTDYIETVYELAPLLGINPAIVVAQAIHETDWFRSYWWQERGNPAGLGITGDPNQDAASRTFDTGEEAARAHLAHLWLYINGSPTIPGGILPLEDPRWAAAIRAGYAGIADTIDDLTDTWAKDPLYGTKLARHLNALDEAGLLGGTPVATTYIKHTWPGLPPVYLPSTLKASVKIIPDSVPGWWASVASTRQTTYTQHFTGNMASSAASEWNWAYGGGRADIGSDGSYHLIVDGREVIVAMSFGIAAGHAANNTGNLTSYACEMAIAGGYEAAFQNAAHVAAAVIVAKGWQVDTTLLQHWNWLRANGERKNCPSIIRDKGDWSRFVATTTRNAAAIRSFLGAGGPVTPPAPTYAEPAIIPELDNVSKQDGIAPATVVASGTRWFWVGDRVRTTAETTGRYQRASKDSAKLNIDLKRGEEFDVDWITEYEGNVWYYTPYGTRIFAADVERISDAKGGVLG